MVKENKKYQYGKQTKIIDKIGASVIFILQISNKLPKFSKNKVQKQFLQEIKI